MLVPGIHCCKLHFQGFQLTSSNFAGSKWSFWGELTFKGCNLEPDIYRSTKAECFYVTPFRFHIMCVWVLFSLHSICFGFLFRHRPKAMLSPWIFLNRLQKQMAVKSGAMSLHNLVPGRYICLAKTKIKRPLTFFFPHLCSRVQKPHAIFLR